MKLRLHERKRCVLNGIYLYLHIYPQKHLFVLSWRNYLFYCVIIIIIYIIYYCCLYNCKLLYNIYFICQNISLMLMYVKILHFTYKIFGTYYFFYYYCTDNISLLTKKFIYMENLTALLHFIQEEHIHIHSVTFKHYVFNHVLCEITFIGKLDSDLISLINLFIADYGAKLHPSFSTDNVKISVISELNR